MLFIALLQARGFLLFLYFTGAFIVRKLFVNSIRYLSERTFAGLGEHICPLNNTPITSQKLGKTTRRSFYYPGFQKLHN